MRTVLVPAALALLLAGAGAGRGEAPPAAAPAKSSPEEVLARAVVERARANVTLEDARLGRLRKQFARGAVDAATLKEAEAKLAVARANLAVAEAELALVARKKGAAPDEKADNRALAEARAKMALQQAEMEKLREMLERERKRAAREEELASAALKEARRNRADAEATRDALRKEVDRNAQLVKEAAQLRDKAVAAEIAQRAAQDRAAQLLKQAEDLAREVARLRKAGAAAPKGKNPPPGKVEGAIQKTDPSGLVTVSVGQDAGLERGHTLEVFRLGKAPQYLGTLRIVAVSPKEAVGQVVGRAASPLQVGDRVAGTLDGIKLPAPAKASPPADVEGLVKGVGADGLVTVALGSDAGLSKGATLEVFRLKPAPKYLGRIRLVEVTATQAVGKPVGRLAAPIQVGDHVASRIIPQ
jgi:hypothetical protein